MMTEFQVHSPLPLCTRLSTISNYYDDRVLTKDMLIPFRQPVRSLEVWNLEDPLSAQLLGPTNYACEAFGNKMRWAVPRCSQISH